MKTKKVTIKKSSPLSKFAVPLLCISIGVAATFSVSQLLVHAADTTIHGCVDKKGNLRVLSANDTCTKKETPLDWNVGDSSPTGPSVTSDTVTLPAGYVCDNPTIQVGADGSYCLVDSIAMPTTPSAMGNMEQTADGRWLQDSSMTAGNELRTTWSSGQLQLLRLYNPGEGEAGLSHDTQIRYFGISQ